MDGNAPSQDVELRIAGQATPQGKADAGRLTARQLATLLARSGSVHATEERILADVAAGAPVNDDGTIGLVRYAAWLSREDGRDRR